MCTASLKIWAAEPREAGLKVLAELIARIQALAGGTERLAGLCTTTGPACGRRPGRRVNAYDGRALIRTTLDRGGMRHICVCDGRPTRESREIAILFSFFVFPPEITVNLGGFAIPDRSEGYRLMDVVP